MPGEHRLHFVPEMGLIFFKYKLGYGNDGQERDYGGVEASAGGDAATVGR